MAPKIQNESKEDEGWYTKVNCKSCGQEVRVGAFFILTNLDEDVVCDDCKAVQESETNGAA